MVGDSFTSQKIVWSLFFEDGYFCLIYYLFECWRLCIPFCEVWNVPSFWFTFIKCIFFSHQVRFWSKCPFCWKHKSLYLMIFSFLVNTYVFLKQHLSDDNFFSCKNICFPKTTLVLTPIPEGQGTIVMHRGGGTWWMKRGDLKEQIHK